MKKESFERSKSHIVARVVLVVIFVLFVFSVFFHQFRNRSTLSRFFLFRSECILLRYFAKAKAVIGFINSEGEVMRAADRRTRTVH